MLGNLRNLLRGANSNLKCMKGHKGLCFVYCILQHIVSHQWFQLIFLSRAKTEAIGTLVVFVFKKENMLHMLLAVVS